MMAETAVQNNCGKRQLCCVGRFCKELEQYLITLWVILANCMKPKFEEAVHSKFVRLPYCEKPQGCTQYLFELHGFTM